MVMFSPNTVAEICAALLAALEHLGGGIEDGDDPSPVAWPGAAGRRASAAGSVQAARPEEREVTWILIATGLLIVVLIVVGVVVLDRSGRSMG